MKGAIIFVLLTVILTGALLYGLKKQEINQCLVWKEQAKNTSYPPTELMKEQCKHHGITLTDI